MDDVEIPLGFRQIQAAKLVGWEGESSHPEFEKLIKSIAGILGQSAVVDHREKGPTPYGDRKGILVPVLAGISVIILVAIVYTLFLDKKPPEIISFGAKPETVKRITQNKENKIEGQGAVQVQDIVEPTAIPVMNQERSSGKLASSQRQPESRRVNLLAAENGGELLVASGDGWTATIDGKEEWEGELGGLGAEAVYGFKDGRSATFDMFTVLITDAYWGNIKEFELSISADSPTGPFESLGKFETQNLKLFKTPYQEFKFQPVTAKYLKIKLISTHGHPYPSAYEFQLFGTLN